MRLEAVRMSISFEDVLTELKNNISGDILATRNTHSKEFIYLQDGSKIFFDQARNNTLKLADESTIMPHIDKITFIGPKSMDDPMYTKTAKVMIGWTPNQEDLFVTDWVIYKVIKEEEK